MRGDLANLIGLDINFGDALMLIAIMSYGIYTAALRSKPQMHWTSLIFILCLGATLASLPMLAFEAAQGQPLFPDPRGWAVIAYVVIFPSLIGQEYVSAEWRGSVAKSVLYMLVAVSLKQ